MSIACPRVFVSYTRPKGDSDVARRDADFVRRVFACLKRQPLSVWIYENDGTAISAGAEVGDALRREIDACDVFLPVLSLEAFASRWTALEVEYAAGRQASGAGLLIVPLVSRRVETDWKAAWPGPYARLRDIRYYSVDFDSAASLEQAIVELCIELRLDYRPQLPQDPRLPFIDRFVDEVRNCCSRRDDREVGIYCRLMEVLNRFAGAFTSGDFRQARRAMQFFSMTCEYEFPQTRFYYPYVVQAVCEILCGEADAAERTFRGLLENPKVDESVFTGLGHVCFRRKEYRAALAHYRRSLECCPDDPAAAAGIVLCSIMCGEQMDLDKALAVIDGDEVPFAEDLAKLQSVKAFAFANARRFEEAKALFTQALAGAADAAMVVHFARLLREWDGLPAAIALLQTFRDTLPDPVLLHDLAACLAQAGRTMEAERVYSALLERDPRNRRYRGELALVLWRAGDRRGAASVVTPQLDPSVQPLPTSAEEFYWDGLANWICGQTEHAEYDFRRSGFSGEQHYRRLLRT